MTSPPPLAQQHIDTLRSTLIARAIDAQRTIDLADVDDSHHIVHFQGAFWSIPAHTPRAERKRWFMPIADHLAHRFEIDFETLFLTPGKLILTQGAHPNASAFKARHLKVEPVIVQWS